MLLSIIIPVYKVERYVRNTLESIFSQNFAEDNFEVIIVDDGSPDKSIDIVEEFALGHTNLHVIRQKNMGLSCARNTGLKEAIGKYIWFVDSDDTIVPGSFKRIQGIVSKYPEVDIFGFDMVCVDEITHEEDEQKIISRDSYKYLYGQANNAIQLVGRFAKTPVQRYLFKKDFLFTSNLSFYPGIYHEDEEFIPRAVFMAHSIYLVEYAPYRYLVRSSGNIMSEKSEKKIVDKMKILESLTSFKISHAECHSDKAFFDFYCYMMIFDILSDNININPDVRALLKSRTKYLRQMELKGIWAAAYFRLWRLVLKGIVIIACPFLAPQIQLMCKKIKK